MLRIFVIQLIITFTPLLVNQLKLNPITKILSLSMIIYLYTYPILKTS